MRILYLTPTDSFSGGERVTLDIAKAMQQRGHTVVYCGVEGPIHEFVEEAGVPFCGYESFTPAAVKRAVKAFSPDVIHTMDYRASLYAAFTGCPFIAHLHNNPPWLGGLGPNVWAMRFFGARAARIFTVSESVMKEYRFGKTLLPKTTVLGNTIDSAALSEQAKHPETLPEAYRSLSPDVLFFGRLTEQKDPLRFVSLFAALKQRMPHLTAAMIGDGDLRIETEQALKERGLESSVTITGFLKTPCPLAARAKLLVMPSKWEGFGLTCAESLSLGLPCLVSPVGGLQNLVTDACGGVCASDGEFVSRAESLLKDGAAYKKASAAARERAMLFAGTGAMMDKIEAAYFSVSKTTSAPRFNK